MSYPINYPTPQGANIQIFSQGGATSDWIKPQGASFVWFTLIGAGGPGQGSTGGGSGTVTNFMCPAFLIPDVLRVYVTASPSVSDSTKIIYQQKDGTGYTLLSAEAATNAIAGTAMTANAFTAMGFFQSIAGQGGVSGGQSASATTFLSGGSGNTGLTANYGYIIAPGSNGIFQMQPIIVGAAAPGAGKGGIGCGSGSTNTTSGGDGLAVIITW